MKEHLTYVCSSVMYRKDFQCIGLIHGNAAMISYGVIEVIEGAYSL